MVVICSPAELSCKRDGSVIPSGVNRFVGAMCLNLSEELEVPLATNCAKSPDTPVVEVLIGRRRDRRVREIDDIEGASTVRANFVAGCD